MPTHLNEPTGTVRRDEEMSPQDFIDSCYPTIHGMTTSSRDEDDARLELARRGEYWQERKPWPKPELETLSATARLEKQGDRIERMLRYLIAKLPTPTVPKE